MFKECDKCLNMQFSKRVTFLPYNMLSMCVYARPRSFIYLFLDHCVFFLLFSSLSLFPVLQNTNMFDGTMHRCIVRAKALMTMINGVALILLA